MKPILKFRKYWRELFSCFTLYVVSTIIVSAGFIASVSAQKNSDSDVLTNKTIIELTKLGLPSSVILNKIKTSTTDFDVSTNALIDLASKGVNEAVLNEMINVSGSYQTPESASQNYFLNQKTGIYYYNPMDSVKPLKRVEPTVVSNTKSGGFGTHMAQSYSYGLAKSSVKKQISGTNSRLQIYDTQPEFYFYFAPQSNNNQFSQDNWFFATATSPNEFILVKLTIRNGVREIVTNQGNAYDNNYGIPIEYQIPFTYEEIDNGVYTVTPKESLKVGEYYFGYASDTPSQFSNNKLFDFGIDVKK